MPVAAVTKGGGRPADPMVIWVWMPPDSPGGPFLHNHVERLDAVGFTLVLVMDPEMPFPDGLFWNKCICELVSGGGGLWLDFLGRLFMHQHVPEKTQNPQKKDTVT